MTKELIELIDVNKLNADIERFPAVFPITDDMKTEFSGVSRLIMIDRYSYKDTAKETLDIGDLVVLTVKPDPSFPARGLGIIEEIIESDAVVRILDDYQAQAGAESLMVPLSAIEKPLEVFYEQIAKRVAKGLASVEPDAVTKLASETEFYHEISEQNFVPAGRVLYGAGAGTDVTFFNCYVMPFPKDSREGIGEHRNEVMEIMSRGGGVGTNGSTLRPRNALARGVNGKSSGSVSWLDDIAKLTHLVEQGGSRRGAQMVMLASWHPDILEFIISKMQNPRILRFIIETTKDEEIRQLAENKLKFKPLSSAETAVLTNAANHLQNYKDDWSEEDGVAYNHAEQLLEDGGHYSAHNPDFFTGANISVAITDDFMEAVENDEEYTLSFPDVENYTPEQMAEYNEKWHEVGDVREWHLPVKEYRTIKAKEIWNLVNICATYAAEPGIFFIDNANEATNAQAYGQKVVATNPCFTGDMRLLTDVGYKSFEELEKLGKVTIINKDGVVSEGRVWESGVKDVVELRLSNRKTIKSTPDHIYMTNKGEEVEAQDLKGERLMPYLKEREDFNRLYEMYGFIQGDGSLSRLESTSHLGLEVHVGEGDLEIRHLLKKTFHTIGYENSRTIYVQGINDDLRELGFSSEILPERVFPSAYKEWEESKKRSFLRGCYSANGSVIHVGRVAYKTTSRIFAEELLSTLEDDFGINGYITTNKPTDVEFSNGTYTCRESFDINIGNYEGMQRFYNEIGFIHRYKMFSLHTVLMEKAPKVVGIKHLDAKQKVYDFNEPLTNWGVVEDVIVHNCGEQPLAPYSVCNLAAVNLANMVDKDTKEVDFDKLRQTVRTGVRMQDNVIDATPYFLEANEKQALGERRVGLGVMGLADLLIYAGKVYGSAEGNVLVDKVFETIATEAYRESIELAKEKGSFPFLISKYDYEQINGGKPTLELRNKFINSGYMERMPEDIRQGVLDHGIRNSHLLTVAPTGSTGSLIGVSTGLEPYFAFKYFRSGRLGKFMEVSADIVEELGVDPDNLTEEFVTAMELAPEAHVDVQNTIQRWVDSSLSKTVNAPKGYSVEQVQAVYERLYAGGAKGGTVYVDGSRDAQVLSLTAEENDSEDSTPEAKSIPFEKTVKEVGSTSVSYGNEIGDTCPVCREGEVMEIGGCNTCSNCSTQLKCGL